MTNNGDTEKEFRVGKEKIRGLGSLDQNRLTHSLLKCRLMKAGLSHLALIAFCCGISHFSANAQDTRSTPTVGEETRKTYTRFLELAPAAGDPSRMPIPSNEAQRKAFREALGQFATRMRVPPTDARLQGRNAVKSAASETDKAKRRLDQAKRLLKNQEERTPQPDALRFLEQTPLLAEVAEGEDKLFAQVIFWNEVAVNLTANDHTPLPPGSTLNTNPFEQVGPVKTARALAIVHMAMFEAVNATANRYQSYKTVGGPTIRERIFALSGFPDNTPVEQVSAKAAIAYAAYHSLLGVYPRKSGYLAPILVENIAAIGDSEIQKNAGQAIGEAAARAILQDRELDGSEYSVEEPPAKQFYSSSPNRWKQDPLNADPDRALGALWHFVRPFIGTREELVGFRPDPPPPVDPTSEAFKDVQKLGGDPDAGKTDPPGNANRRPTPTDRTDDQTFIGKFWAYDATALLCAPPRLYNMIATSLALKELRDKFPDGIELARYLALVNVAMADAGIGAWEAKYYYCYPRPVTGIRNTAAPDSPLRFWSPLGAPVSNARADKVNFTPPFPAYPSGHAVFGAALFETLRLFFGKDDQQFEFVSDEYNGKNRDAGATDPRPRTPRTFPTFSNAEAENGRSRIYLGIHWQFDATNGIEQGKGIAKNIFAKLYLKVGP